MRTYARKMPKPITISEEEMGWLEDAADVYESTQESPESSKITAYLLKRAIENAIPTTIGYTLYPITQAERTTILDVLNEWRELEAESND